MYKILITLLVFSFTHHSSILLAAENDKVNDINIIGKSIPATKKTTSLQVNNSVTVNQKTDDISNRILSTRHKPRPLTITAFNSINMSASERIKLKPKYTVNKPQTTRSHEGLKRNILIVKFVDGTRIRVKKSNLDATKTDSITVNKRLDNLMADVKNYDDYDRDLLVRRNLTNTKVKRQMKKIRKILKQHKIKNWNRKFNIDDSTLENFRLNSEITRKRQSSDLSNYYVIHLNNNDKVELLADELNKLHIVELAYLAPTPEDADVPPTTPNFQNRQTYLNPASGGIDALYAWTKAGGKGDQVKIIDIESGWNLNHEDLPSMFITDGRIDTDDSKQHGTAVMGIMLGLDDSTGVTGIVPKASGGVVSYKRGLGWAYYDNVAEAILIAAMNLSEGDVILIEQHSRGPGNDNDCTACTTSDGKPREQCGYIAMEYWNDIFDVINAATASGIIVVEAAGNGEMNLDHSRYKDRFNRTVRDSGAIFVGAGTSDTRVAKCWSNNGSRLDLQGWGENVMTTGYGSSTSFKINGNDDNQWYTTSFSGTSSATPIVAAAVASVQGVQIENNNPVLDWYEMGNLLKDTGTPQGGSTTIGPLPNLKAAIDELIIDQPPAKDNAVYSYTVIMNATLLETEVSVAGYTGDRIRTLGTAGDLHAIERLKFGERSDRGCYVRVEKAHIVKNTIANPHDELDLCGNNGPTDRSLEYVPLLTTSHDTFVHGVSVCNSKTNNEKRLKGVKLYRTRVEEDGSFSRISNPSTMDRPNCDGSWDTPVYCPDGALATKLVVHIEEENNGDAFSGLGLKCKKVQVKRTCVSGC